MPAAAILLSLPLIAASCTERHEPPPSITVPYTDLGYDSGSYTFENAPFTGIATEAFPDGQQAKAYGFKDGAFHGVVREWYEDGTPKTETHFRNGQRHGKNTYWHPDGKVMKRQVWKDDVLVSEER